MDKECFIAAAFVVALISGCATTGAGEAGSAAPPGHPPYRRRAGGSALRLDRHGADFGCGRPHRRNEEPREVESRAAAGGIPRLGGRTTGSPAFGALGGVRGKRPSLPEEKV